MQPRELAHVRPRHHGRPQTTATPTERVSVAPPAASDGPDPVVAFGEHERGEAERQEERLGVDGAEEDGHREERQVEHRAGGAGRAEPWERELPEELERDRAAGERDISPARL